MSIFIFSSRIATILAIIAVCIIAGCSHDNTIADGECGLFASSCGKFFYLPSTVDILP